MPISGASLKRMLAAVWKRSARLGEVGGAGTLDKLLVRALNNTTPVTAWTQVTPGDPIVLSGVANKNAAIVRLISSAGAGDPAVVLTILGGHGQSQANKLEFRLDEFADGSGSHAFGAGEIPFNAVNIAEGGFLTIVGNPAGTGSGQANSTSDANNKTFLRFESSTLS